MTTSNLVVLALCLLRVMRQGGIHFLLPHDVAPRLRPLPSCAFTDCDACGLPCGLYERRACSIVGGGLSGLATAFYLQQQPELWGANIRLIEAQQQLGGSYVCTAYANAGVLHEMLHPAQSPQGAEKHYGSISTGATVGAPARELVSLVRKTVQDQMLLRHKSVTPAALRPASTGKSCSSTDEQAGHRSFGSEGTSISMEFGAAAPHLLAPGGGHVLRMARKLLMPSQLVIARRQAASVFSLMRSSTRSARGKSWFPSLGARQQHVSSPLGQSTCKPGLSRLNIAQALFSGVRESCLTRGSLLRKQQMYGPIGEAHVTPGADVHRLMKDMPVSSFAETHSSKALARGLLLPAFSACSCAG